MSDIRSLGEGVTASGLVKVRLFKPFEPHPIREFQEGNLITSDGLSEMADAFSGVSDGVTHMATGSDNTAASVSDTALGSEAYRDSVTQYQRTGSGGVTYNLFIGAASANGTIIREAGLFDAASNGTLIARVVFDAVDEINKTSSITAQISWTITFS